MKDYAFHDPLWLLALLLLPLLVWVRGRRGAPVLVVPFAAAWHRPSLIPTSRWPAALALTGLVLLILALARPQIVEDKREVKQQGYDLMLAIDLSGSMLSEDYERGGERINRLQAIKPIIQAFISQRPSDRIGLVVFSGRAYTLAPLTFDHDWLARQIERLKIGMIEDGTAIGDGLGISLTRLEQAKREEGGKRKGAFIVLMTDGANNRGVLTPEQATEIAKARGVPVYTIGAGRDGLVPFPVRDETTGKLLGYRRVVSDLDEGALQQISAATGGKFFRAFDVDTAEKAFAAIDQAQKIEFTAKSYLLTTELFTWVATPGASLLFLGALFALPPSLPLRNQSGARTAGAAGASVTTPAPQPSAAMLAAAIVLVGLNLILGYLKGVRTSENPGFALGVAMSQLVMPALVALLFSIGRSFRNLRSLTRIVFWTSFVLLLVNLGGSK
jgi:Ca-activated chloride channel family protein